jgi:hypothetical protein
MKHLVVHASKSALPVQQVEHVVSPASPNRQVQLFHMKLLSFGRKQDGANVTSKAAIGPGPRQGRDIDDNRDLVAARPI